MENAIEALKMAFAFLVFVMALTVSIIAFGNVKKTADVVLYAKDETNYYEYIKDSEITGKAAENRIVGLETIIPTLYKYYKENYLDVHSNIKNYSTDNFIHSLNYLNEKEFVLPKELINKFNLLIN